MESQTLEQPIFTPKTKAPKGKHDQNLQYGEMIEYLCEHDFNDAGEIAEKIHKYSLVLYKKAHEYALTRGLVLADTKFEFGLDEKGVVYLADELMTPDSSRYWGIESFSEGRAPPSFDKQIIRDYLHSHETAKALPEEIIEQTRERYIECYRRLTGETFKE